MMKTHFFFMKKKNKRAVVDGREGKKLNQRQNENYMYTLTHGKHNIAH